MFCLVDGKQPGFTLIPISPTPHTTTHAFHSSYLMHPGAHNNPRVGISGWQGSSPVNLLGIHCQAGACAARKAYNSEQNKS